jgi:hypothetical protein
MMGILLFLCFEGETGPMVAATLKLGIAILNGGNSTVQQVTNIFEEATQYNFLFALKPSLPHISCMKC